MSEHQITRLVKIRAAKGDIEARIADAFVRNYDDAGDTAALGTNLRPLLDAYQLVRIAEEYEKSADKRKAVGLSR